MKGGHKGEIREPLSHRIRTLIWRLNDSGGEEAEGKEERSFL